MIAGPLSGITVLDLTRVLAGPFCTLTLADLGARVIKVEHPEGGDLARQLGPMVNGVSGYTLSVNRGKEGLALDLKREEHERKVESLSARWDQQLDAGDAAAKRATLEALRERLLERNYINNLLATIDREASSLDVRAG